MAILAPAELPSVLKVRSEPCKKYVLSKLGFPQVNVEISEDQWETIWRVSGDFIASYFPREQKLAVFWTSPLKPTYPLPEDAYWIQQVNWDPITTRIDDVFGAESFLFCLAPTFKILDKDKQFQMLGEWKPTWKAHTPYGSKLLLIKQHTVTHDLPKVRLIYENGIIEGTQNHIIKANEKWLEFGEVKESHSLQCVKNITRVHNIEYFASRDAFSVRANGAGCYYGCTEGEPVLLH